MNRLLLITAFLLGGGLARADWTQVYEVEQLATTIFVDLDTLLREGNLARLWVLYDSKTAQFGRGGPLLSTKAQSEFDCTWARSRILVVMDFSGNMGSGKVVHSNSNEQQWEPVVPGSVSHTLWRTSCGK